MDGSQWILCNGDDEIVISTSTFRAGRSTSLDMVCLSNKVSRDHALFVVYPNGTLHVQDNQSANGTYINGQRIDPNRLHQLHVNDEVGLGLHSRLNIGSLPDDLRYIFIVRRRLSNEVIVLDDVPDNVSPPRSLVNGVSDSPLTREGLIDILDSDNDVNLNQNIELATTSRAEAIVSSRETSTSTIHYGEVKPSTSSSSVNYFVNNPTWEPENRDRDKPSTSASVSSLDNYKREPQNKEEDKPITSSSGNHFQSNPTHGQQREEKDKPAASASSIGNNCKREPQGKKREKPSTSLPAVNELQSNSSQRKEREKPSTFVSSANNIDSYPTCDQQKKEKDKPAASASCVNYLRNNHEREPQSKNREKPSTSAPAVNGLQSNSSNTQQRKEREKPSTFVSSANNIDSYPTCEQQKKEKDKPAASASCVNYLRNNHEREPQSKNREKPSTSAPAVNGLQSNSSNTQQRKEREKPSTFVSSANNMDSYPTYEQQRKQRADHLGSNPKHEPQNKVRDQPSTSASSVNNFPCWLTREPQRKDREKPSTSVSSIKNHLEINPTCEQQTKENGVDQKENEQEEKIIKEEPFDNINNHNGNDYTIEDGCIIIDDDDQFPCSQLLNDEPTSNNVDQDCLSESIFCSIKKELEELDKLEDGQVYACVDLVESDEEGNEDWISDDKSDEKNEDCPMIPQTSIQKENNNEEEISSAKVHSWRKTQFVIPPIITPHFETKIKNNRRNERISETKIPEKRKIVEKENEQAKKIKTSAFYNAKSKRDAGWKRKRKEAVTKETKEQIQVLRKKKLKEIAEKKPEERESKTVKCKTVTAKVKVSDSRGKFLTENIDMPSTSRAAHTSINGSLRPRNASVDPRKPISSKVPSNSFHSNKPSTNHYNNTVHNNNHIQPPKPTPFVPKSVIPVHTVTRNNIPKNCEGIGDILIRLLNWKTIWFSQWKDTKNPPPIHDKPLSRVGRTFSSYKDYYATVMPLFELELWHYIVKGFNEENEPRKKKFIAQIEHEIKMDNYTQLQCYTYVTKKQYETVSHLKEEDALIVQFAFRQSEHNITIPMLGYVTEVYKRVLLDKDFIDADFGKELAIEPHAVLTFKVLVQAFNGTLQMEKYMHIRIIASLVPTTRIIRSVKYLERSALCQHVLKPTFPLYTLSRVPQEKLFSRDELNAAQYQAVMEATDTCLRKEPGIYMIQGPPGTGKSTVIINIIQQILFRELNTNSSKQYCILVVAPSNAAVDELTSRLIKLKPKLEVTERKKIKLVRLGPKNMINSAVEEYSLLELAKRNIAEEIMNSEQPPMVRRNIAFLQQKITTLKETANYPGAETQVIAAKTDLEQACRKVIGRRWNENFKKTEEVLLEKARIICTTLSSCVGVRMQAVFGGRSKKIQCCIVDEATQSSEQETLIPLMLGIDRMVLVGDPKQLPGVTLSKEAKDCAYGQSLFSRIMSQFERLSNNPIRMLNTQYRMHQAICEFPSKTYYNGNLKTAPTLRTRSSKLNILKPYLVFNFKMEYCNSQEYSNNAESDCVLKLLTAITENVRESCAYSVGIVTPYNSQKQVITAKINHSQFKSNVSITVNTVDSFQGQEKDIIIMSCVRDYSNNFVSDEQRLNVAMTRARHALYIIGSDSLLKTCASLGKVYDDARRRHLIQLVGCRTSVNNLSNMIRCR